MHWSQTESSKWSCNCLLHDLGRPFTLRDHPAFLPTPIISRRRKKPEALRFEFKIEIEILMTKQRAHTACRSLSSQTSSNRNGPTSVPAEPTHASRMASRPDALPAASHSWHRAGARSRISCRAWDRVRVVGSGQGSGSGSGSGSGQGSNSKAATSVVSWRRRSSTRGGAERPREAWSTA